MSGKLDVRGVFVPMVTPFKENQDIDEEALRSVTDFLVESGVNGIIACGSTGEYVMMSQDEHKKVVRIVVDQANGKIPVVAGAGNHGTKHALALAKYAKDVGADGILAIAPYYHTPTDEGLLEHFKTLAEEGDPPHHTIQSSAGHGIRTQSSSRYQTRRDKELRSNQGFDIESRPHNGPGQIHRRQDCDLHGIQRVSAPRPSCRMPWRNHDRSKCSP